MYSKRNVEGFLFFLNWKEARIYRKGKNPNMKGKYIGRIKDHLSKPVCRLKTKIAKATITTVHIERIGNEDEKLDIEEHKMWGVCSKNYVTRSVMSASLQLHGL